MFTIMCEVLRRGLKGSKMIVSEGIAMRQDREELTQIVQEYLLERELVDK